MKTVAEEFVIGRPLKVVDSVGIEIEVEGSDLPPETKYFRGEYDGSLRGESCEFVLRKPLPLDKAYIALDDLGAEFDAKNSTVDDTVRAGVHVHINVQDLTLVELYNMMTIYLILENLLVKYCGEFREGNLFCLRAGDAEYLIYSLREAAKSGNLRRHFNTDLLRYASMNVKALAQYGSLEFRAMRSTRDMNTIKDWAAVLMRLKHAAKGYHDPTDIIYGFSEGNADGFINHVLGDYAKIFTKFEGYQVLVARGIRTAQHVAFATDWGEYRNDAHKERPLEVGGEPQVEVKLGGGVRLNVEPALGPMPPIFDDQIIPQPINPQRLEQARKELHELLANDPNGGKYVAEAVARMKNEKEPF